ncbi:MAG: hypothetical protein ACW7DS_17775 [Paraglaciecola chathamensis]
MKKSSAIIRILAGTLIAPWLYIIVWTMPVLDHSAFHKWVVINTFFAYIVFLIFAGISHFALKKLNATKLWSYCVVMFFVAVSLDLVLSIWSLSGYESNYYSQTQVVESGSITKAGYLLQVKEALINGAISSGTMAIFWFISIFSPKAVSANA